MPKKIANVPDFTGKVLSINLIDDDCSNDVIFPHFEMQGERLFLVGTVPEGASESKWTDGATVAIAWERVTDYFVFDSLAHYNKAIKKAEKHLED